MIEKYLKTKTQRKEYEKYKNIRGKYVYEHVILAIEEFEINNARYEDITSLLKYDKNLRDELYLYLATFEEYFKVKLFSELCNNGSILINYKNFNDEKKNIIKKQENEDSLYYNSELSLGKLIELNKQHSLNNFNEDDLDNIRKLRNSVMHHSLLTLGKEKEFAKLQENLETTKKEIISLKNCLPADYQIGFRKVINKKPINKKLEKIFKITIWGVYGMGVKKWFKRA